MTAALTGRTALVSGGGNGLGASMARHLADAGARVVLVGRDISKLEAVAAELPDGTECRSCDVSDPASVEALVESLSDLPVDILVNNAGVGGPVAEITAISPDEWDEVFAINVRGVYLMCRAFLPGMIERGAGDVVNVASVTGKRPLVRRTPYAASKMAVIGLTQTLAFELGDSGVRVNTLSPGPVDGARMDRNFSLEAARTGVDEERVRADFLGRAAMQRMVTEDEVGAALVAMLGIPGMTGADVDLSAGMIA